MKKLLTITALLVSAAAANVNAQTASAGASQTTNLNLANAISITFVSGGATGDAVNLAFNTVNDYANGVISGEQQMLVKSNKYYNVSIQTNGQNFTYSGTTTPSPAVTIANVLQFMITANNTGGSLSYSNYASIPSGSATIINWARPGGNQTFAVKYKATPGFALPAGTYTANVVYTATQQ